MIVVRPSAYQTDGFHVCTTFRLRYADSELVITGMLSPSASTINDVTFPHRQVARYNSLQQNSQSINVVVHHSVLLRAKPEILRVVSLLIEKSHGELVKFLIEV